MKQLPSSSSRNPSEPIHGSTRSTAAAERWSAQAPSLLVLAFAWAVMWFLHALPLWDDKAWRYLDFARSLTQGRGFEFDGRRVYGDFSPVWIWLLEAVHLVVPGWLAAGKTLTVVSSAFFLSGVFAFARSQTDAAGRAKSQDFAAAMVLAAAVTPYFGFWAYAGTEALLTAGMACWGLVMLSGSMAGRAITPGRYLLGCFFAGTAPLLRLQMGLFTLLLGSVLFVRWVNLPVRAAKKATLFFSGLSLVVGPGVAWAVYAAKVFKSIVPDTLDAQLAAPNDSVLRHLVQIYAFGFPPTCLGLVALMAWSVYVRKRQPTGRSQSTIGTLDTGAWLVLIWTVVTSMYFLARHLYVKTSDVFITAPLLTVVILATIYKLKPTLYHVSLALGVLLSVLASALSAWPLINNSVEVQRGYAAMATFLRTLPANDPVVVAPVGEVAFLSAHPLVDWSGNTQAGVIPFLFDATDTRRIWWAHEQGARYAVLDHSPEPGSTLVWSRDIPVTGWFLKPSRYRAMQQLMVWKLPASPTLPLPPDMPTRDEP